ncbi:adenosylcobinamide-GDP ribazoletransferase [Actinorugispora endophytica]|nr:adenosylcobinamide-GDP ribazoletransferase [Actinorugispora endophytica]
MALGTLTAVPVRVDRVDRTTAAWAMALAPVVAVLLAGLGSLVLAGALLAGLEPLLAAALAVGALALLTRGLHLDGLADVADGLGSGRPAEGALEVMKRSDIGPFGVVALVFAVLVQVLALGALAERGPVAGALGLAAALLSGRLAITWACTPWVRAARPEGLGAFVARSVPYGAAAAATCAALSIGLLGAAWAVAVAVGLAAAAVLLLHVRRRLGGVTGDVLGALAETAAAAALVAAAAL